jgi:hypothetical protein
MNKFLSLLLAIINFMLPAPPTVEAEPTPEPVRIYHEDGSYTEVAEGQDGTDVDMEDLE